MPISADQVQQVLGSGKVAELAKHAGIDESETANVLSGLLPQVVDKITPGGGVPAQAELVSLVGSLGKLFG
ncbi:MAG: YidB family protein [Gammaproteobacteria bacterium]